MEHLPEVLKLIEGGLQRDAAKVDRYAEFLASKLDSENDPTSSKLIRDVVRKIGTSSLRSAKVGPRPGLPVDNESRLALAVTSRPLLDEAPLVLPPDARAILDDFVQAWERRSELLKLGITKPGHLLMFGPPGCGKSQTARFLAARIDRPLVTARLDALVSSLLGNTAKNLRALFDFVDQLPCVLFLDEFDAVAKKRDDAHEMGELKRVVNSLLQNIDLLSSDVVVVAATNHPHLLDPAVWRRFEFQMEVSLPGIAERETILGMYLPGPVPPQTLRVLAALTDGLTPADIELLGSAISRERAFAPEQTATLASTFASLLTVGRRRRLGVLTEYPVDTSERIRWLRARDPKVFTYDVVAEILGISKGKISNVLNKEKSRGG